MREPFGPDGLLLLPTPVDVVSQADAAPLLEAAHDELTVLRLELDGVEDEIADTRRRAAALGLDPTVASSARQRLAELVGGISADADRHAAAVAAGAAAAAAEVLRRAEDHARLIRAGQPLQPITAVPPIAPPLSPTPAGGTSLPTMAVPAVPTDAGLPQPPAAAWPTGWVVVPEAALRGFAAGPEPEPDPAAHYSRTLGLLQVVTWSILVAAVLIVLLAWFG